MMNSAAREKALLDAGRRAQRNVSRGTTLIFKCPVCKTDNARAVVSKSCNTLSVKCDFCAMTVFDYNYRDSCDTPTRKE